MTKGSEAESVSKVKDLAEGRAKTVMSSDAWRDYEVPVSPYFVLADGRTGRVVGEGSGTTWPQVARPARAGLRRRRAGAVGPAGRIHGTVTRRVEAARAARLDGPGRERRADDELRRAGIGPGHPSLYGRADGPGHPTAPTDLWVRRA